LRRNSCPSWGGGSFGVAPALLTAKRPGNSGPPAAKIMATPVDEDGNDDNDDDDDDDDGAWWW